MIIARRNLKGTNVDIRENLTLLNATLIEDVARRDEVKSAWSGEGKTIEKANMPRGTIRFLVLAAMLCTLSCDYNRYTECHAIYITLMILHFLSPALIISVA